FVVLHVEDGVQLGDLQQVVHFLGEVEQLEFAALVADAGESADQFADAGAVDVINVSEVEQDLLVALGDQVADGVAQDHAAFAEGDTSAQIYDCDSIYLSRAGLHTHWEASLRSAAAPGTCLIILISVPAGEGLICTSSMNERIKKIPRPEVFSRFSGARGSGIEFKSIPLPWSVTTITRFWAVFSKAMVTFFVSS